jgi:uncharacterized membrane protein YkvA (DUF1232 family)
MDANIASFHEMLETRVTRWLESDEARAMPSSGLYRHLPALFLFLTRVALDERVPDSERRATLAALKYIVAPFDLVPEGIVGTSGFRDDLVLAAVAVERLFANVQRSVLMDHWQGPDRPEAVAASVLAAGDAMVGAEMCSTLCAWLPS